uniref:Uncharacterized protein n=1 Tax=Candidatus Kentrum sp. SD TaxID=2126332 RepID=A0A450YQQ7_9GAMM|nr:MAG: hypothetical protein BECKSD772F_GA0070984_11585 [Candidatus Kentron sp. SD]VFK49164.1 MAG: hypothetical protein BECKSD772E_GA0070983_11615 [Candidatus Kentron sp. SD]
MIHGEQLGVSDGRLRLIVGMSMTFRLGPWFRGNQNLPVK